MFGSQKTDSVVFVLFLFQAEDGIRDLTVTGVQTCALPILTRFLPYGMRYSSASMLQIHKELEESAAMSGASWSMTFRRVVLPLLKPGLLAGFIYVMIVSIRELSSSILLYSPGSEVVSIMIWELWQNGQYVELSALGVMLILALFLLVVLAQLAGRRFGIAET